MSKVSTASSATATGEGRWKTETARRSDRSTHEDEKRDPVAYWYAEALSRR